MPAESTSILSSEIIADAAIDLADEGSGLSVTELADRLRVSASSLYHHTGGRAGILELMHARLLARADLSAPRDAGWEELVRHLVRVRRTIFADHPHVLMLMLQHPVVDPEAIARYERLADHLREAGLPEDELVDALGALDDLAIGAGVDAASPAAIWTVEADDDGSLAALARSGPAGRERSDRAFEFGLELLVAGLRARIENATARV